MASRSQSNGSTSIGDAPNPAAGVSRPRLFVLSDVRLFREGLVLALSSQPTVIVLGSSDVSELPTELPECPPDVLLLDVSRPGNLDKCVKLRDRLPTVKIVAFAVGDIDGDIIACAEAGVSGWIPRTGSTEDVVAAVHGAVRGELLCPPRTTALLFSHMAFLSRERSIVRSHDILTQRETEVVTLVEHGLSNKEIARSLQIEIATVRNHVHSILSKLQLRRRGEAAAWIRRVKTGGPRITGFAAFAATIRIVDWSDSVYAAGLY